MTAAQLRDEALMMLAGKGAVLEADRELTLILEPSDAIIGGVAVFLHGHIRTTDNIDLLITSSERKLPQMLNGVPIRAALLAKTASPVSEFVELEGVRTI